MQWIGKAGGWGGGGGEGRPPPPPPPAGFQEASMVYMPIIVNQN